MEKKHWWAPLILGIILLALGIVIFLFPGASYLTMSIVFGAIVVLSGIMNLAMAFTKGTKGKGWLIICGIIEIVLGILLLFLPGMSALTLPLVLGFWLFFKGFALLGSGYALSRIKGKGWGWTIFSAIILIICGCIILLQPMLFGVEAVIWWSGISFIFGGCTLINYAFQLKDTTEE